MKVATPPPIATPIVTPPAPPPTTDSGKPVEARGSRQENSEAESLPPQHRPYFLKGELAMGAVHPLTRNDFIGVAGGISGLPSGFNTALNSYFLTIEPQIDLRFESLNNLRIGLGVPLQMQLADPRAAFEVCLAEAKAVRDMGGDDGAIVDAGAKCVQKQKDHLTDNLGQLRKQDYDENSDYAKLIRYITIGGEEKEFYLNISRVFGQSLGHGTVVRRYNANLNYNTTRVGATLDAYHRFVGFESMVNDIIKPDVLGIMGFVRPLEPIFTKSTPLRSLSLGASIVVGLSVPRTLGYEVGLLKPSNGQFIPALNPEDLTYVTQETDTVQIAGFDVESKLIRTESADMKVYYDLQQMKDHGGGQTLGTLWRFSFGQPAFMALRVRAEGYYFDADYLPSFFDGFYDIHKNQYLPSGYTAGANRLSYYPTKLGFLEANKGGRKRLGGMFEITHSFVDLLTVGAALTTWSPTGDPQTAGFVGPSFPDITAEGPNKCTLTGSALSCPKQKLLDPRGEEKGYASLLLHAEVPFKSFLQGFATYQIFGENVSQLQDNMFKFKGNNEVLFSGVRIHILPLIYLQAEARRFYFLQRVTNIDIDALRIDQDQNYRAQWTFGLNINAGLEF